jgi:hypothetical protein
LIAARLPASVACRKAGSGHPNLRSAPRAADQKSVKM